MPQVVAIDGMSNGDLAGFGPLHGIPDRCRQDAANAAGFAQRQQAGEIVLMQARARGVMHQHPLRIGQRLQAGKHGVGAFAAAVNNGNLRMGGQRQLAKADIAGADGNHHALDAGVGQQRGDRVFENRFVTD